MKPLLAGLLLTMLLGACGGDDGPTVIVDPRCEGAQAMRLKPAQNAATDTALLKDAFINAASGDVICLDPGTFVLDEKLTLSTPNVTVLGTNMGARDAILDFHAQAAGSEAIEVTADHFLAENFAVLDSPADGLVVRTADFVTIRNVFVSWSATTQSAANGAYGLFPIQCDHVLIEDSEVSGSRDAGIYVGQSTNVIVRRNKAHENVAGIEIEVTKDAEVYDNETFDNTAGILVFNLANLPVKDGRRTRVYNNNVHDNNHENFATGGTIVAIVPPGVGMIVLANDQVEMHDNTVSGHKSAGIAVVSYLTIDANPTGDPDFDPYVTGTYIHDNTFSGNGEDPQTLVKVIADGCRGGATSPPSPPNPGADILWDGRLVDPAGDPKSALCLENNGTASFLMFDDANQYAACSEETTLNTCTGTPLTPLPSSWE
jgi:parallel beta-helix repeat protein